MLDYITELKELYKRKLSIDNFEEEIKSIDATIDNFEA